MTLETFQNKKIFVAGHRGMVGSALVRKLEQVDTCKLLLRTSSELDLCDQAATNDFFESEKPDVVIFAAAKVGGIHANNTYPADKSIAGRSSLVAHLSLLNSNRTQKLLFGFF